MTPSPSSPTTRIRELHDAACRNTYSLHGTQMQEFIENILRLAPALCDVIDAARKPTACFEHADNCCADWCHRCKECIRNANELEATIDALDRAAEEGRSQGSSQQAGGDE